MNTGIVKWFDQKKGFGFIIDDDTKKDIFVHYTKVISRIIKENDRVTFKTNETKYGKEALDVVLE